MSVSIDDRLSRKQAEDSLQQTIETALAGIGIDCKWHKRWFFDATSWRDASVFVHSVENVTVNLSPKYAGLKDNVIRICTILSEQLGFAARIVIHEDRQKGIEF